MKHPKLFKTGVIASFLLVMWVVLFKWHFVLFKEEYISITNDGVCYSPNHDFYFKYYQTPLEALLFTLEPKGIAVLYDKTGKELHRGYAKFFFGPKWVTQFYSELPHKVSFDANAASSADEEKWWWHTTLPTSPHVYSLYNPGKPRHDELIEIDSGCYDRINYYFFPNGYVYKDNKLTIKPVEPLEKTEAPYQLQFLIQDHEGIPVWRLQYMIIRADGSRQRGVTEQDGKTFVVGSTQQENITFYFSPYQSDRGFMLPEELTEWCTRSPNECSRLEEHTFTANTIQVRVVR